MVWQEPTALYFLWIAPLWVLLALYARARRRRAARAFAEPDMRSRILPAESTSRFWVRTTLGALGLIFGILALARPRFGEYLEEVRQTGSDLCVLLDVSRSMLSQDVPPNRLAHAKDDLKLLLKRFQGERVGLIAFAGKPVVKCPLTSDYAFFRLALEDADSTSAPLGGTNIGDGIRRALEVLPKDSGREQAVLLITDGEDHESYPLEAAQAAADRHVAIFTVGLGDASEGARVPDRTPGAFLTHEGKQVWSKLDQNLLREIALRTQGVYVPVGVRPYDLGQLYVDHLSKLRGEESKEQKRKRLEERFQLFLLPALLFFLAALRIRTSHRVQRSPDAEPARPSGVPAGARSAVTTLVLFLALLSATRSFSAEEPPEPSKAPPAAAAPAAPPAPPPPPEQAPGLVEEGLSLYQKSEFKNAREKFVSAEAALPESPAVSFDLACAYQREKDVEHALEAYRKAALAPDRALAISARYNMGCLEAEHARELAGKNPEQVPPEKRQEILDGLLRAVGDYRECLDRDGTHARARKNLELIREWIKYYSNRWTEQDRDKRRQETGLLEFLEYLMQAQEGLAAGSRKIADPMPGRENACAELKRAQDELAEEIPTLKQKIEQALNPSPQPGGAAPSPQAPPPAPDPKRDEARKVLFGWADESLRQMGLAGEKLGTREPLPAASAQDLALENLEHIWEAAVPFPQLLGKNLEAQTGLAQATQPASPSPQTDQNKTQPAPPVNPAPTAAPDASGLAKLQTKTLRHTRLMLEKARQARQAVASAPAQPQPPPPGGGAGPAAPDPKQVLAGLDKAIELTPSAFKRQEAAEKKLLDKQVEVAHPDAEEARRILEEIAKAQPKPPEQKNSQDSKDSKNGQNGESQPDPKKDEKKEKDKQDQKQEEKKKEEPKKEASSSEQQKKEAQEKKEMSEQQAEAILRKVREREQDRRRKLEEIRGRMIESGGVDKDW